MAASHILIRAGYDPRANRLILEGHRACGGPVSVVTIPMSLGRAFQETAALGVALFGAWGDQIVEVPDGVCPNCRDIGPAGARCTDCGTAIYFKPTNLRG